jgi:hypothetical protein
MVNRIKGFPNIKKKKISWQLYGCPSDSEWRARWVSAHIGQGAMQVIIIIISLIKSILQLKLNYRENNIYIIKLKFTLTMLYSKIICILS